MTKKKNNPVTLIEDPFGISTQDIRDAQNTSEELDLDADLISEAEADESLERISKAMEKEAKKTAKELKKLAKQEQANTPTDPSEQIANELAEEEALQKLEEQERLEAEREAVLGPPPLSGMEESEIEPELVESCIEALLFIADRPLPLKTIRENLGPAFSIELYKNALTQIQTRMQVLHRGIELVEVAGGFQFRTKAERANVIRRVAKIQKQRLSRGAMESLAIIAYRQPVMREEIDKVRGVDSSHFIRILLERKLIEMSGRSELPGRPILYSTTQEFLQLFGLKDLENLPPLHEIAQMVPTSEVGQDRDEDPNLKKIRDLVSQMNKDKGAIQYDPSEDEKLLKEIRERVKSIPVSTPFLEEMKNQEQNPAPESAETQPELIQD